MLHSSLSHHRQLRLNTRPPYGSMTFIVFSGLPGTGKSTVAGQLAPRLGLPLLDKDDFLATLFVERGVGNAEWRTAVSREADERFVTAAQVLPGACLVSWWRPRGTTARSGTPTEWLSTLPAPIVEVHCRCSVSTAVERFLTRQRHPGHLDSSRTRSSPSSRSSPRWMIGRLASVRWSTSKLKGKSTATPFSTRYARRSHRRQYT